MLNTVNGFKRAAGANAAGSVAQTAPISTDRDLRRNHPISLDCFAASIVHDLRNPLAAICASAEMLIDSQLTPTQIRRLGSSIQGAASRMRALLSDLLVITPGYAEKAETCSLRAVVRASCEAARLEERQGIQIQLDVPEPIELPLARSRMERVLLNLIVNAAEAMPGGGIIRIMAVEAGARVLIAVEDDGPGIPADIRGRLFEPFVTAGKQNGLGLGLALARQAVWDHGGDLWVEPAEGARFVISLPVRPTQR